MIRHLGKREPLSEPGRGGRWGRAFEGLPVLRAAGAI